MYIFVQEYMGGLGNQLYQYFNLIYLSKVYNKIPIIIEQNISPGYINSKVYKNLYNLKEKNINDLNMNNIYYINYEQFEKKEYDLNIDLVNYNICLKGLNMNIYNFKNILYDIRNILKINETIKENNCLISFRSFNEESKPEWRIDEEYYNKSIKYAIENIFNINFIAFTDDYNYAYDILEKNNLNGKYIIYHGKRDGITDIDHFYKMMECNHAILVNSSFATWSMIMNNINNNHKIIIPNDSFLNSLGINEIIGDIIRII